ncbi:hypothetical protein CEP52_014817 [Fusarium oligoseptatum]|uniref:PRISE-like Rossmann-fold domain-containing protein n=1 Tax=Fusarium oligoseptatum TaxID=2604345 RepID=A0A428SIU8_9HYPO|nr:hypothetical protein CEP52_014817 [Fusarium oligoseptatum]
MAPPRGKVAFITGANGITGNAIVENLIRKPESEWSKIIITSRRTPTHNFWQDHRVRFIALDFLRPVEELIEKMAPLCHDVTHAFFASYVHTADFTKLRESNIPLFHNFLVAIDIVAASSLQRVCLQTGGKYYGAHLGPTEVPLHEEMERYEDHGENFYYPQEDFLFSLAAKRSWNWNIIRPNGIIGFTPSGNGMSMALTLALYMLCCREMGQPPVFPGNKFFYNSCVEDSSYAPSIADMSVWAVTTEHAKNEAFNHANGDVFVWKHVWTKIGRHFGIEVPEFTEWAAKGDEQRMANNFLMTEWSKDKKEVWERVVAKHGGQLEAYDWGTWDFFDWAVGKAWCTISSVSKARKFGWQRYDDTYDTYIEAFQSFENAGVLPRSDICHTAAELRKRSALLPHPGNAVLSSPKGKLENGTSANGTSENGVKHNGVLNGFQNGDLAAEM